MQSTRHLSISWLAHGNNKKVGYRLLDHLDFQGLGIQRPGTRSPNLYGDQREFLAVMEIEEKVQKIYVY